MLIEESSELWLYSSCWQLARFFTPNCGWFFSREDHFAPWIASLPRWIATRNFWLKHGTGKAWNRKSHGWCSKPPESQFLLFKTPLFWRCQGVFSDFWNHHVLCNKTNSTGILRSRVIPPGFLVDPEGLCHKIQPLAVVLYRSGWTNRCRPCRNMPVRRWGNLGVVVTDVVPIDCGETQRRWKVFFVEFVVCRCWIWQRLQKHIT